MCKMGFKLYWNKLTMHIVNFVEKCFYNLGVLVAKNPWRTIILCWVFVAFSCLGLLNFYRESHAMKLWVPPESDFAKDTDWLIETFHIGYRPQYILAKAPNVLDPSVLTELAKINEQVNQIKAKLYEKEYTWTDICFKVPIVSFNLNNNRRRRSSDSASPDTKFSTFDEDFFNTDTTISPVPFDPSVSLDPSIYCGLLKSMELGCLQRSILDLWKYNVSVIEHLKQDDIIEKINLTTVSPVLGHKMQYIDTLGGVQVDENGKIVSAKSILLIWLLHVNFTNVDMSKTGNEFGTEEWASESTLAWEKKFLHLMNNIQHNVSGLEIYYEAGRSYGDVSSQTMFQDLDKLVIGIAMMFIYIQLIISKFNWVEFKFTLGSVGLLCIGMALIVSVSLCSLVGIPYGPVHSSLPFLIMGLGIDDMFVMKACWEQLTDSERKLPLPNQIGLMLKHAGVSIVITSFTDIVAFLVGAITILPSLQSFCFYAAVGVLFVFVFSVTFYVAIFVLDIRRMETKRNGLLLCMKHPNFTATKSSHKSISQRIIHYLYSNVIFTLPVKVLVILGTLVMTGVSLEALLKLEQRFEPIWFIPDNTYFKEFLEQRQSYFPDIGNEAMVYIGAINYTAELPKIYSLVDKLENETEIIQNIDSWTRPLKEYIFVNFNKNIETTVLTDLEWRTYLSKFLFSPSGASFQSKFRFSGNIECGKPSPPVIVSSIDFRFKLFPGPSVYLPAMHTIKNIVKDTDFQTGDKFAIVWAKVFATWVTDEIIHFEVERNLELALICVMACTVILITDLQICFWIFMCVLLTLVNVCGWMQRWGLTIDIVSCVGLELAIGLCVDYAAHVGHTFLTVEGTKNERALKTVTSIGAAVLYGGGSTFLSLSVLSMSESYIFKSFFKIFLLVIVFGLFHGIVFLPVILSLIGPISYLHENERQKEIKLEDRVDNDVQQEQIEKLNTSEI